MGLFSIKPQTVDQAAQQVWFPNVDVHDPKVTGERSRVMNYPGFKRVVDAALDRGGVGVQVFQVDRNVKGPNGTVVEGRPGLIEEIQTSQGERGVATYLPVRDSIFGEARFHQAVIPITSVEEHALGSSEELHRYAAGTAIFNYVNGSHEQPTINPEG